MEMNGTNEQPFEIPELPSGRVLRLELLTNWSDSNYVGLNAVEVYSKTGKREVVDKVECSSPGTIGDINAILRVHLNYKDSCHLWKCKKGEEPISISLLLLEEVQIAMIRIWNYNESRVHAQVGVRDLRIFLDETPIFQGEINPAFTEAEFAPMGDTVLFTTDETILESIAENDVCLVPQLSVVEDSTNSETNIDDEEPPRLTPHRPPTAEPNENEVDAQLEEKIVVEKGTSNRLQVEIIGLKKEKEVDTSSVKVIHLELLANWGHRELIGLTGVQFFGPGGIEVPANEITVTTSASSDGIDHLLNGRNLTRCAHDMWAAVLDPTKKTISISFQMASASNVTGISFWNYNGSTELSFAGVRCLNIYANGKLIMGNVVLRKALGCVYFDYVQDVFFDQPSIGRMLRPTTHSIGGFIFQLQLLSTWGDEFYIGLNGVQLFNRRDQLIKIRHHNLAAFPESINILPSIEGDPRTSENIINGQNDTANPAHMWLTPLLPNRCARVFFVFDVPTYVSKIIIYNYRKTPCRGVRHISLSVDDLIIYSGEVPRSSPTATGSLTIDLRESNEP